MVTKKIQIVNDRFSTNYDFIAHGQKIDCIYCTLDAAYRHAKKLAKKYEINVEDIAIFESLND